LWEQIAAEIEAIKNERPRYNKVHAPEKPVGVPIAPAVAIDKLRRRLAERRRTNGAGGDDGIPARIASALDELRQNSPQAAGGETVDEPDADGVVS
jgi:hypothetical protein